MNVLALLFTLAVAVSSTLLITATTAAGRRNGAMGTEIHDPFEAAFLTGGPARVVDTALTSLHADGRLVVGGPGIVAVHRAEAHEPVERAVLQELAVAPSGALHLLRATVMRHPSVQEIGDGLAARGLLSVPGENRPRRRWALTLAVSCLVAVPVGVAATIVEYTSLNDTYDLPAPFILKVLPAILFGAVVGFLTASSARARITKAGRRAVAAYRAAYAQVAVPAHHMVATRGLGALPDPELRAQLLVAARVQPAARPSADTSWYVTTAVLAPVVWCAGTSCGGSGCGSSSGGGGGCGAGSGSGCGGSSGGSSCGGSSGGSSCGGGGGGSSCGGGGGS